MLTLKGRTMAITGGAGNNGLAVVRMALEYGMNVAFLSSSHAKAQRAIAKLDPKYADHVVGFAENPQGFLAENQKAAPDLYQSDSTDEDVLRMVYERFGSIDVFVNGSGSHTRYNFEETDEKIWARSMEVVHGVFFNTKRVLPYLKKSPAPRIINLTTANGRCGGYDRNPSFAAARGGIIALTYELAKELGPYGITVNCVCIGHIEGDVPEEDRLPDDERAQMLSRTPLGRLGTPGDVAGAVNFLASEEASFITGEVIDVNGGILMG